MRVRIVGDGIAARTCAHLLAQAGLTVAIERIARPTVPAILLGDQALHLIRDVFGLPGLLAGRPRIARRIVRWGGDAVTVPHGGVAVPEALLLERLGGAGEAAEGEADFTIRTTGAAAMHRFGARRGTAAAVRLRDGTACRAEAVAAGWLFLVPVAPDAGWLLGVGAALPDLLADSRAIAPHVDLAAGDAPGFDTCPRLADPLAGADWLACGSAALGFDPMCGDGAAQAVREAILAAAVVVGIAEGGDRAALLAHYEAMLVAAMRRHLAMSLDYYRSGGDGDWWRAQHDALRAGHDLCTARLARTPEPRFLLRGDRLVPRAMAA